LIVAPDQPLLDAGLALFADRPDKSWSHQPDDQAIAEAEAAYNATRQ
jgi:hypothetical protein